MSNKLPGLYNNSFELRVCKNEPFWTKKSSVKTFPDNHSIANDHQFYILWFGIHYKITSFARHFAMTLLVLPTKAAEPIV
ncbi:MAG: hypothetical protein A2X81_01790 [Desulfobacterales bacterium GWB2_56_26]|nr:MAG: hypothetical protein A2X81_01790 [Desulfobacterales bacterium GWB2_56_26]